jgi:hypothetical protein
MIAIVPCRDLRSPLAIDAETGAIEISRGLTPLAPLPAASKKRSRQYLNGIFLQSIDGKLISVATDGFRVIRSRVPAGIFSSDCRVILPRDGSDTIDTESKGCGKIVVLLGQLGTIVDECSDARLRLQAASAQQPLLIRVDGDNHKRLFRPSSTHHRCPASRSFCRTASRPDAVFELPVLRKGFDRPGEHGEVDWTRMLGQRFDEPAAYFQSYGGLRDWECRLSPDTPARFSIANQRRETMAELKVVNNAPVPKDAEDLAALWINTGDGDGLTRTHLHAITIGRPKDFFRTHPSQDYRRQAEIYVHKSEEVIDEETYLIMPSMHGKIDHARLCSLVTVIYRDGTPRFWAIPSPRDGEKDCLAWLTARSVALAGIDGWVKPVWKGRAFITREAEKGFAPDPDWSRLPPFDDMIKTAFGGHGIIRDESHPVYRAVMGKTKDRDPLAGPHVDIA